jgi:S1-C subfamily serine protease
MKKLLFLVFLLCFLFIFGCSHTQNLINPDGQTYTCSSHGWGIIGGPMGINILNNCVKAQKQLGFVEIEKVGVSGFFLSEWDPPTILKVQPQGPAAKAGIQSGDKIISVNGQPAHSIKDALILGFGTPGQVNTYEILRGDERKIFSVTLIPKVKEKQ